MNHQDHTRLLQNGIPTPGGTWADLGCGSGAFTLAVAELLGPNATIIAVDKKRWDLHQLSRTMKQRFPETQLQTIRADFTQAPALPPLDGLIMANSLHFIRDKGPLLRQLRDYLQPNGRFILVEYNVDQGNHWVPYPVSFNTWQSLALRHGWQTPTLLATQPSRFLGEIYAALVYR